MLIICWIRIILLGWPTWVAAADSVPLAHVIQLATAQTQAYLTQHTDSMRFLHSQHADGNPIEVWPGDWTSGFFAGKLWYLYVFTHETHWRAAALRFTLPLATNDTLTTTHDLGFMVDIPFARAYTITHDQAFREVLLQAARSLMRRYNPRVGQIRSWDGGPWHYPVIVDNLMNLELLFRATALTVDSSFYRIAVAHIDHDLRYRFRPDYSTYHVLDYDPQTGQLLARKTWQGYADSSCWSRGQAWAVYGLTMAYRYTRNPRYLHVAQHAADYFLQQLAKAHDLIPPWDFQAPDSLSQLKDVSAAAILASALLELQRYVPKRKAIHYLHEAQAILQTLSTPPYLTSSITHSYFLLQHATGDAHHQREMDVPLIYADYYFLQALWRYSHLAETDFWF
ncbi:MAG: glycoside hydrolase family 88 protein [Thermoflavifilum sp.]|nr:glycoside hydrolase family 88 protein [Thermoflavifilum sp.]